MTKKLKGKTLGHPFVGYRGYKIWHKKEGRFYVCLVPIEDGLKRTTITLAKYKLSRYLGRRLSREEQVDHRDGDKSNDKLKNLQILTGIENIRKQVVESGRAAKYKRLPCPVCGVKFERLVRNIRMAHKQGRRMFCSKRCSGIYSHWV